jgi:xanthine dehydrogenase molybdopterin-binding subunit B
MPPNSDVLEAPLRHVYKPLPHDSGAKHVQGSAEYIDDIPERSARCISRSAARRLRAVRCAVSI